MGKSKKEWHQTTGGRRLSAHIGARGVKSRKCKTNNDLVELACKVFGITASDIPSAIEKIRALPSSRRRILAVQRKPPGSRGQNLWSASRDNSSNVVDLNDKRRPQRDIEKFYESWDWKRVRYDFIKSKQRKCECCGASAADGTRIVVDHIKPIRYFWGLRLDPANLQLLCDDCNMGKGSRDTTDWRPANEFR